MYKAITALIICWLASFTTIADAASAIRPFEPDSLAGIVASQKGKPFVLLIWSLDCEYCQASLDTLAEEKLQRKKLNIVTVSVDSLRDQQAAELMRKRLTALDMTNNAWAFGSVWAERLRYAIDPQWHGEMPRSYWFNANGEKTAYSGILTSTTIEKLLSH